MANQSYLTGQSVYQKVRDLNDGTHAEQVWAEDPFMQYVIDHIGVYHGDTVTDSHDYLTKFGRTRNADSDTKTTIAVFQGSVVNETFATGNTIDSVVSSSATDTQTITVAGHTVSTATGYMTVVTQDVTLTGQTAATLTTPLYRVNRAYVTDGTYAAPAVALSGNVAVFDSSVSTNTTSGVPNVATATKLIIEGSAGKNQSEKCATSTANGQYLALTKIAIGISRASASTVNADADIQYREIGGVWRPLGLEIQLRTSGASFHVEHMRPYQIIHPNTDFRFVVTSNTNDTTVTARMSGQFLAT